MTISNKPISEVERNKRLMLLLQDLITKNDSNSIELLRTMVVNDTPSMQKSFEIMSSGLQESMTYDPFKVDPFDVFVPFSSLRIGQEFECYGDEYLNYDYPRLCRCVKTGDQMAQEINGIYFFMNITNEVSIQKDGNK